MTRLTLICHAGTAATRRMDFPRDEPIEPKGRDRAAALSGSLGRADRCWTSPALRARQTAQALGLAAEVEPALCDLDHGRWAGQAFAEVAAREPAALAAWMRDPGAAPHGGESVAELLVRVAAWLDRTAGLGGAVVAITHPAVVRAAVAHALAAGPAAFWRIDVAPLGRVSLSVTADRWLLRALVPERGASLRREKAEA